jgi:hypothetical protein
MKRVFRDMEICLACSQPGQAGTKKEYRTRSNEQGISNIEGKEEE